uniref:Uncharacterized protein n=1 Tax=Rhizophora mucronata TaxID=61149 RepID=A0A2P2IVE2_RHIMU
MKQGYVYNGSGYCSKTNPVSHCKEGAKIEGSFPFVSRNVKVEIGIDDGRDIVVLTIGCEEIIGEYREGFGLEHIEPIA